MFTLDRMLHVIYVSRTILYVKKYSDNAKTNAKVSTDLVSNLQNLQSDIDRNLSRVTIFTIAFNPIY